jgi:hypothetical protein
LTADARPRYGGNHISNAKQHDSGRGHPVKAAVLHRVGEPLHIEEVAIDPPGPGEVAIRVVASGICHSDLSVATGVLRSPLPVVLGHEAAGVVEAVGPGVADVAAGDHVVLTFDPRCGTCAACGAGKPAACGPAAAANAEGRLLGADGATLPGLYAVGWAKRGPTGLIGDNVADAEETVRHMLEDLARDVTTPGASDRDEQASNGGGRASIERLLESRGVRWVTFDDWVKLDALEVARGKALGKIREKFSSVEQMLAAIDSSEER